MAFIKYAARSIAPAAPAAMGLRHGGQARAFQSSARRWEDAKPRGHAHTVSKKFRLSNTPPELYPLFFVVGAGVIGAAFAIFHSLTSDKTLRLMPEHRGEK